MEKRGTSVFNGDTPFSRPQALFPRFAVFLLPEGELGLILHRKNWKFGWRDVNVLPPSRNGENAAGERWIQRGRRERCDNKASTADTRQDGAGESSRSAFPSPAQGDYRWSSGKSKAPWTGAEE